MEKKEYIKPEMNVFKADMQALLADSSTIETTIRLERASDADYKDEQVKSLWDSEETKTIWAD